MEPDLSRYIGPMDMFGNSVTHTWIHTRENSPESKDMSAIHFTTHRERKPPPRLTTHLVGITRATRHLVQRSGAIS